MLIVQDTWSHVADAHFPGDKLNANRPKLDRTDFWLRRARVHRIQQITENWFGLHFRLAVFAYETHNYVHLNGMHAPKLRMSEETNRKYWVNGNNNRCWNKKHLLARGTSVDCIGVAATGSALHWLRCERQRREREYLRWFDHYFYCIISLHISIWGISPIWIKLALVQRLSRNSLWCRMWTPSFTPNQEKHYVHIFTFGE